MVPLKNHVHNTRESDPISMSNTPNVLPHCGKWDQKLIYINIENTTQALTHKYTWHPPALSLPFSSTRKIYSCRLFYTKTFTYQRNNSRLNCHLSINAGIW